MRVIQHITLQTTVLQSLPACFSFVLGIYGAVLSSAIDVVLDMFVWE